MVPRYYAAVVQVPREFSQIPSFYFLLQWQKTAFAKDRGRFELGLHDVARRQNLDYIPLNPLLCYMSNYKELLDR